MKKEIHYPAEITFKVFFTHRPDLRGDLMAVLEEQGTAAAVSLRSSRNGKHSSFTITSTFSSEEQLNEVCSRIASLSGFFMMI
ncbi:MAG: DUF493 domain-containing protein [Spirochaetes bacterium]|nr:DUF493 domain-containing protein [Spirochaetota bacterium]